MLEVNFSRIKEKNRVSKTSIMFMYWEIKKTKLDFEP